MTRRERFHALVLSALAVAAIAALSRIAVVVWASGTFPPAADGVYYDKIAARIASGHGYTWVWPDGAVTYAAHYPVGYPALIAIGYAIFGAKPVVAMVMNALLGVLASVAAWAIVRRAAVSPVLALAAGIALAVHPVLLPYTAAIMTEGVTASLLVIATATATEARERGSMRWLIATGIVMGIATLVRPQVLALAPVLGLLAVRERHVRAAAIVSGLALAMCLPWTARNCVRMDKCALVSVNGGWNLAIGTQTDNGGWREITVPDACKTVFQEAAKDECFGREALKKIAHAPLSWLARAPSKLRMTFDYFGAAPWYLHTANATAFPYSAKVGLGAVETLASRLLLAAALVGVYRLRLVRDRRELVRKGLVMTGLIACVLAPGTLGYLALALALLTLGLDELKRRPLVLPFTAITILVTAATHAVFFGSGRYGLVIVPFVTMLSFRPCETREPSTSFSPSMPYRRSPVLGLNSPEREESPSSTERDAG